jgi:hypothetical protein
VSLHNAPSVSYPLGRSRFLGLFLLFGWSMAAAVTIWWWRSAPPGDWRPLMGALCCLLAGLAMTAGWWRSPLGQLQWDGTNWYWESEVYQASAELNAPVVALDLQSAMLLRLDNPAGAVWWLWAERAALPERWLDMRRAVFAPRRPLHLQVSDAAQ